MSGGGVPPLLVRKDHALVCAEAGGTHPQVEVRTDLLDLAGLCQHPVLAHVLVLDGTVMKGARVGLGIHFLPLRITNKTGLTKISFHEEGEEPGITHGQVHDQWVIDQGQWDQ